MQQYSGPATSSGKPHWEVTRIEDGFGPASFGSQNRIKLVFYRIDGGKESYVEVPYADFTAEHAFNMVAAAVEAHDAVAALNSTSM